MIRLISFVFLGCGLVAFVIGNGLWEKSTASDERDELWKQVQQDLDKGLPKSAIATLQKIHSGAINDGEFPEATRALCQRFLLEGQIDQPVAPYVIRKLQTAVAEEPAEMRPVLKTILAEWYFAYYLQNQWRFRQRSSTASAPGDDFETWDLARILNEIDRNFSEALASADELKQIPIATYDELLEKGSVSDRHRPTLYDFLAFEALQFYALDEQFIRQQGAFQVTADSPIFGSTEDFLAWEPATEDTDSYILKAIRLYQDVLNFHADDEDRTAWLDADLDRLMFGRSVAQGSETVARWRAALQRFADDQVAHPLSASALAYLATSWSAEDARVRALEIAGQGLARFPDSRGGRQCFNLIQQIRAKSSAVSTERVWHSDRASVDFRYRNVGKVWLRLVEFDYANWREWGDYQTPQNLQGEAQTRLLKKSPVAEWSFDLPATADYLERIEKLSVDVDVRSGCYLLLCSHNADFDDRDNAVSAAEVWVSKLAVVMRREQGSKQVQGQVLDAETGQPLSNVRVRKAAWLYNGRESRERDVREGQTDENGFFKLSHKDNGLVKLEFRHDDQRQGLIDNYYLGRASNPQPFSRTVFFTDRSIYRPGQTIRFKGICVRADQQRNRYQTLPGQSVAVSLIDANNQKVEELQFRTNEFGSFSGSFTAPRDRATGRMRLQCQSVRGSSQIRVEEYKRPKFFVTVPKPQEAFRLGQPVEITGQATAYTGAPIDGASVAWRVVREVRYPSWYSRRYWYLPTANNSQEIAHGVMKTDAGGKFKMVFTAEPDRSVDRENEPVFSYSVYADVTDTAGETRSASQTTRLGYTSLKADLDVEKWLTSSEPVEVSLEVTNLDGEGQAASGNLRIYKLTAPETVQRARLASNRFLYVKPGDARPDFSRISAWPTGEVVHEQEMTTDDSGKSKTDVEMPAGAYRAVFETTDSAGQQVRSETPLVVLAPQRDHFDIRIPHYFLAVKNSVEPGETFEALWGTGYDSGRAFVEFEHRGKVFQSYWTDPGKTQHLIRLPIIEKYRGGVQMRLTWVRENRAYTVNRRINVPWSNKELTIQWEHFVSKLQPGGRETWTAIVKGPSARRVAAEMVAGLYDASLDAYAGHYWQSAFRLFYTNHSQTRLQFYNRRQSFRYILHSWDIQARDAARTYRHFDPAIGVQGFWAYASRWTETRTRAMDLDELRSSTAALSFEAEGAIAGGAPASRAGGGRQRARSAAPSEAVDPAAGSGGEAKSTAENTPPEIDLSQVSARKNLQETAFFFPHLTVDEAGTVRIEFEVPEALTKWKFLGFAHDNELRAALLTDEMTTSKELMVQPNPPRFLREGDLLEFSVKVSNQSQQPRSGSVRLSLADARTGQGVDETFGNRQLDQSFEIPAGQSQSLYWKIAVPDFTGVLTWKAVGATEKLSDGEEGFLPVLSRRILVTESLPLPIRGNQTKQFDFERLRQAGQSDTLKSQALTVQVTSNPSWYAVMSLPYLMQFPHECSEQVFNRLYANALGRHIVTSDPRIGRIFQQWRGTDALDSPLEKNEELRNVLLAESPWLLAGKKESQARRNVGILFDQPRLESELRRTLHQLAQMQLQDGAWPWFPGGRANDYITLYVTTGFGRLRHLGVDMDVTSAIRAVDRLDWWLDQRYQEIRRNGRLDKDNLSPIVCLYFYGRSFFLDEKPVDPKYRDAFNYFAGQGKKWWVELRNRQSQGHLAIALKRMGDRETPSAIMASLTERSLQDEELGMFWREADRSWWWYRAPVETQALMIEAYDEVAADPQKVEELKIWLLRQKQTQNWKTTRATADACYGLLLRGTDRLASGEQVVVRLGGTEIRPESVEAGTGFYQQKYVRDEIRPEMGQIEMVKSDDGIAWGSIHWQYLEDIGKIEPWEGTPLTVKKALFVKKNTDKGPLISPVEGPVGVGDELVVRVELRVDRAMEYVHLKDYRGSGTEPVNVLSRYRYQDGLAYYESTKDTASHFFIEYLPRGTYVFEYSVRVQHRGVYETGIAELQCMYAPEFNSHSASIKISVE